MAITTKEEFKQYCLRKLGKPVIHIEVDDDQLDDRITQAIKYWNKYHYDGNVKHYFKHQLTADDISNKYIDDISSDIKVVSVFPVYSGSSGSGSLNSSANMFNINYQFHLNMLWDIVGLNWSSYVLTMMNLQELDNVFNGQQNIRFNQHQRRIYIDMDWSNVSEGQWLVFKTYLNINPETYPDAWNDEWLQKYATNLIKHQWGENLSKFTGMQLPGGRTFNAQRIIDEADKAIEELEQDVREGLPVGEVYMA